MRFPITEEHLRKAYVNPEDIATPYPAEGIALLHFCNLVLSKQMHRDVLHGITMFLTIFAEFLPRGTHRRAALKICLEYVPAIESAYPESVPAANLLKATETYIMDLRTKPAFQQAAQEFVAWMESLPSPHSSLDDTERTAFLKAGDALEALACLCELDSEDPMSVMNDICGRLAYAALAGFSKQTAENQDAWEAAENEHFKSIIKAYRWGSGSSDDVREAPTYGLLRGQEKPEDTVYIDLSFLRAESRAKYCLRDPDGTWYVMHLPYFSIFDPLVPVRYRDFTQAHPYIKELNLEPGMQAFQRSAREPWNRKRIRFADWNQANGTMQETEYAVEQGPGELKILHGQNEAEKESSLRLLWSNEPVRITILYEDYHMTNAGGGIDWSFGNGAFCPHGDLVVEGLRKWETVSLDNGEEIFFSRFEYSKSFRGYELTEDTLQGRATLDPVRRTCIIYMSKRFDNSQ